MRHEVGSLFIAAYCLKREADYACLVTIFGKHGAGDEVVFGVAHECGSHFVIRRVERVRRLYCIHLLVEFVAEAIARLFDLLLAGCYGVGFACYRRLIYTPFVSEHFGGKFLVGFYGLFFIP